jgi:carboxyl-terminal processing protease
LKWEWLLIFLFGCCAIAQTTATAPIGVETACELIYQGKFDAAGELIEQFKQQRQGQYDQLGQIVAGFRAISQRRQSAQEAAYEEKLAELEKLRAEKNTSEVNEVNDITKAFSVITETVEFADEVQKNKLLRDPFVKQTVRKARAKAAEFESQGKWLDAYLVCYNWLKAIDPNNKADSDYADRLLEKADIVASFQDSPCETCKERFQNVEKKMFLRAIDALDFSYVSPLIDYRQMAAKGIERCRLLAEVAKSSAVVQKALQEEQKDINSVQYDRKLTAFSAALASISDEINTPKDIGKDKFKAVFEQILSLNEATTALPSRVLIVQFADAALQSLDPYTVMIWPRQVQDFERMMTNEFTGIGIEITKSNGLLTVASLLPDTPAYRSGLDAGDVIEAVDGLETKDMSLTCAVRTITGPAGTKVVLMIRSPGDEHSRDITITRAKITVPTIRGWQRAESGQWLYMIDKSNKIGYVQLTSFSEKTSDDLEKVLKELESQGMQGLILDLRANSGGLLDSAIDVADKFIEEGLIVSTRPRYIWTYASAHKEKTHPNYPMVVLVDRYSASASEIVAGALADKQYERAILVGERTHGKGSVQSVTHHPKDGAQLKYTMAYYHLPSGQRVESQEAMKKQGRTDWGVGPNIEVKLRSDEFIKMAEVQRDNDVLAKAGHDNGTAPLKKHTLEDTLAADPQLAVGILVVKTKLIQAGCAVN